MTSDPVVVRELVDATNGSQSVVLIIDELGSGSLDVGCRYGVDAAKDLGGSHSPSVREELTANILGYVGVSIEAHEHGSLEVDLGALNLLVGGAVDKSDQVGHDVPHKIIELVVGSDGVDAEEASVLVARVEGSDGMGELVLGNFLAHFGGGVLAKAGGTVVGAEHGLHNHEGEGILGRPGGTLEGEGNVGGVVGIEADANIGAREDGRIVGCIDGTSGGGGKAAKVFTGKVAELTVINGTGTGNDHTGGGVVSANVIGQISLGQRADILLGAQNSPSKTGTLKGRLVKTIKDQLLLLLVNFGHFAENDVAFTFNGRFLEFGVKKDVR
mmetsp:Transcript_1709/g.3751  ORF Transcript_1709/g.3751 Transcript_1709/m.3751 type:complete len:328 (-) Transcript_1709:478-1461(-)